MRSWRNARRTGPPSPGTSSPARSGRGFAVRALPILVGACERQLTNGQAFSSGPASAVATASARPGRFGTCSRSLANRDASFLDQALFTASIHQSRFASSRGGTKLARRSIARSAAASSPADGCGSFEAHRRTTVGVDTIVSSGAISSATRRAFRSSVASGTPRLAAIAIASASPAPNTSPALL